jgi:predicted TIM-barrel fold metal-dependent hydrolase
LPDGLCEPFRRSTARLQLLFQINLGNIWDYPYHELHTAIAQLVDTIGSDRLMYGTDMPNVERFCSYRQTLGTFRLHCRGLVTDADIANIVGGTAAHLFGLKS